MNRSRIGVWALTALGGAIGVAYVPLLAASDLVPDEGLWIALDLVIGWGFVGAGALAWRRRPDSRIGALMMIAGFAWYLSLGQHTEPALLFTVGSLSHSLFAAAAIHLVLGFPSGRLRDTLDRGLVAFAYLSVTIGIWVPQLFFDPAAFGCPECPQNLVLVESNPGFADGWLDGLNVVGIVILLAVLASLIVHWRDASPPTRRIVTPVFAAGGALMVLLAALLAASLAGASQDVLEGSSYAILIPFGAVPYLFLGGLARARMLRGGAVGALITTLGEAPGPGELRDGLADAFGDPSVELAYWLPESEQHVDARGRPVELPPEGSGRAVHEVMLDGNRVAAIVHDATLLEEPQLVEAAGAAAALALERERLDAELRARVEELSDSRARMLRFGMAERRRLERDLHDGAQQRLVSLALDLRLAREKVRSDPGDAEELLGEAAGDLAEALEELRELARGIHPALLGDRGLGPAIEALARRAPLPVEIESELEGRVAESAELAAYFVVSEALTNVVKYAQASRATVRVAAAWDTSRPHLVVEVSDDGVGGADLDQGTGLRGLADRITSLGGKLDVDSEPGAGTVVRAQVPCE